jgi:general secretion pathway protein L
VVQTGALGLAAGARGVGFTDGVAMLAEGDAVTAVALRQGRLADLRRLRASDPARLADQAAAAANEMDPGGRILLAGPSGERLLLRSLLRERGLADIEEPEDAPLLRGAGDDPLAFLPAVGLALAALGRGVDLDLIRQERNGRSWEWTPDRKRLAALAALVLLLGVALAVADYRAVRAEHSFWQGNLRQSWTELFPTRKLVPGKEKELLQVEVKAMEKRLADLTNGGAEGEGGAMPVLADLSRAVPPELDLGVDELALDPGRLRLEGSLPSFEAIDRLKSLLEATPRFSGVEVQNARVGAKPDRVNFRLKAEVN